MLFLLMIIVVYIWIGIDLIWIKVWCVLVIKYGEVLVGGVWEENIKIIKVLLIIVILFVFCMLLVYFVWMLLDFGGKRGIEILEIIFWFLDILVILYSCLNVVIYGVFIKYLWYGFVKYLLCFLFICYEIWYDELRINL